MLYFLLETPYNFAFLASFCATIYPLYKHVLPKTLLETNWNIKCYLINVDRSKECKKCCIRRENYFVNRWRLATIKRWSVWFWIFYLYSTMESITETRIIGKMVILAFYGFGDFQLLYDQNLAMESFLWGHLSLICLYSNFICFLIPIYLGMSELIVVYLKVGERGWLFQFYITMLFSICTIPVYRGYYGGIFLVVSDLLILANQKGVSYLSKYRALSWPLYYLSVLYLVLEGF